MMRWINQNLTKSIPKPTQQDKKMEDPDPDLLPGTLACRILELQFLCQEQNVNKSLIVELTSLYLEAIQYYQAHQSQKYKIYQKRNEFFLKKTAVIDVLQGKSGQLANKREDVQKLCNFARNKSKNQVNRLLSNIQKKQIHQKQAISKMIQHQNKTLEERIHKRKTMSNRSSCSDRDQEEYQENKNKYIVHFEKKLDNSQFWIQEKIKGKRIFI